jgi:tRNA-dihydrouridine synthase 1
MAEDVTPANGETEVPAPRKKLTGRAFYESIGSPKYILAPMVDQSEFVSQSTKSDDETPKAPPS